jgi:alpha-L-fucosidase
MQLGYGLFIHFGPNTFSGSAWGDGAFPAAQFDPVELNCSQWAEVAAEAGMKYAVLTTKHHDGFCLWPSAHTEYSVEHAPRGIDVVQDFVTAFREAGIKPGFYYSLWDRNYPRYDDDAAYAEYMRRQVTELLSNYGPIVQMWFDGGWDKEFPTRDWRYDAARDGDAAPEILRGSRWEWKALYDLIHQLQPDCLVMNNSSSHKPGCRAIIPSTLARRSTSTLSIESKSAQPDLRTVWANDAGENVFLPLEFCTSLNPDWFHIGRDHFLHPSPHTIAGWLQTARAASANLLLNIGPDKRGLLPEYHRHYLRQAAEIVELDSHSDDNV